MIVKIWPVGSAKSKSSETASVNNCLEYITDAEKVIASPWDLIPLQEFTLTDQTSCKIENINRTITYMADEDKIEAKYISGYLCHPEGAVAEFSLARSSTIQHAGITRTCERGAYAYHLVQSFPSDLDISDAEVHQCGLELVNKLGKHQAVVCSHVHPKIAEDGVLHGKCKHNHILINAYVHPDKLEPGSKQIKYHDCKETYAQLQVWNDEIAISHGLPIIYYPDTQRSRSWYEADASRKGTSWKDQMRLDIEHARRSANNWEQFVAIMEADGYQIRDGTHICYTAPDGKSKARGSNLGRPYTKDGLLLYWKYRAHGYKSLMCPLTDNESPKLYDIVLGTDKTLKAAVPLGGMRVSGMEQQYYFLPLERTTHRLSVLETYFSIDEVYDICDDNNRPVAVATGQEIIECMELMREGRLRMEQECCTEEERIQRMLKKKEEEEEKERYYMDARFRNSRTKRPYRCPRFNDNGTRRSSLELFLILAATVLLHESGYWDTGKPEPGHENDPIFGPTNWKIQNIIDSIYIADDENIETPAQLDARLQRAGANLSRARSALNKATQAKDRMEPLKVLISDYLETRELAESMINMEDGPEKERLKGQYSDVLETYSTSKNGLRRYNILDEEKIIEFQDRYEQIGLDIEMLQQRLENTKAEYRRLKKLSYNLALAQNERYCYGPAYGADKASRKSIDDLLKDQHVAPPAKHQRKPEPEITL